ncbi:3-deoxy-D-manno-octulosonic acid transferase [Cochlodiniinecator piscidefendens]|uniref:3-deoxy-D-manno-octulosonic acid transferase n=1 Tax=Cochlodiniinecator piscidefendens TaxID=2715756 RepID=UPI00140D1769|nr:hypothetical protein [Cochlodiniinecator piscidefendens]
MSERAIQYYANTQNVELKSEFMGRLQPGIIPQSCNEADREALSEATLSRQIWLAVHCAEDEVHTVLAAHRMALRTAHRLLLIIAAPNPEAGNALRKEAEALGFLTAQRSVEKTPGDECQIFIADTDEGLGLWYRLSPISFLGQSVKRGLRGVDPCEAAALGSAILHGPWIGDHRLIYDKLDKADAARVVHHQEGLAKMVGQLMAPDVVAEMAQAAWMIATEGAELSDALLDTMMDALDQSGTE